MPCPEASIVSSFVTCELAMIFSHYVGCLLTKLTVSFAGCSLLDSWDPICQLLVLIPCVTGSYTPVFTARHFKLMDITLRTENISIQDFHNSSIKLILFENQKTIQMSIDTWTNCSVFKQENSLQQLKSREFKQHFW